MYKYYKKKVKGVELTVADEIFSNYGGGLIFNKDQKVTVINLYMQKGYDSIGIYHDKCIGVEIKGFEKIQWELSTFNDSNCLSVDNFLYWIEEKKYKFHHGGWYLGGQSATLIRTIQQLYKKYLTEQI